MECLQPGASFHPAAGAVRQVDGEHHPEGEVWEAVVEGDCGRPYKYTITMEGKLSGGAVMFKGAVDPWRERRRCLRLDWPGRGR